MKEFHTAIPHSPRDRLRQGLGTIFGREKRGVPAKAGGAPRLPPAAEESLPLPRPRPHSPLASELARLASPRLAPSRLALTPSPPRPALATSSPSARFQDGGGGSGGAQPAAGGLAAVAGPRG